MKQIVYVLINDAMPGLVKVGRTDGTIEQRMRDLYKTGVPVPFECFRASVVKDAADVEPRIHRAFDKYRVNKNREFFEIAPESIVEILEMVEIENVTPGVDIIETEDDLVALQKMDGRSKRYNFSLYGIPIGATLTFDRDESTVVQVVDGNNVLFENEEMSLSAAAVIALRGIGKDWKQAQGPAYWLYNGEKLKDRKDRMEAE